jgi:hypothetical protein
MKLTFWSMLRLNCSCRTPRLVLTSEAQWQTSAWEKGSEGRCDTHLHETADRVADLVARNVDQQLLLPLGSLCLCLPLLGVDHSLALQFLVKLAFGQIDLLLAAALGIVRLTR